MKLSLAFIIGYFLDLLLGDPPHWPHPIRLIGRVIEYWETALYQPRVVVGALFFLAVLVTTLVGVLGALDGLAFLPAWAATAILAWLIYTGLATRALHVESRKVEETLKHDLEGARELLARIVGRETGHLSPQEIHRAVLETVAENLADGVIAPLFFLMLLGVPGLFLYKAVNTMDSMVGYKNLRYARFGKVAARADDILNFLPARLAALLIVLAAPLAGADRQLAWRILRRDAGNASSPNAGWPEAAMAGALGVRLGGPSTYFGETVPKPFIGEPIQPLSSNSYGQAVRLLYATSLMMAGITFLALQLSGAGAWGLLGLLG